MFQILKDPQFDFMRLGKQLLGISAVFVLVAIVLVSVVGLNLGIEFTGGTEVQLKYRDSPDIASIRSTLSSAGLTSQTVTSIGEPEDNEVYIRIGTSATDGDESSENRDPTTRVLTALGAGAGDAPDLNLSDQTTLQIVLLGAPGMTDASAAELAEAILARRREVLCGDPRVGMVITAAGSQQACGWIQPAERLAVTPLLPDQSTEFCVAKGDLSAVLSIQTALDL